jgi:hypothetical protein
MVHIRKIEPPGVSLISMCFVIKNNNNWTYIKLYSTISPHLICICIFMLTLQFLGKRNPNNLELVVKQIKSNQKIVTSNNQIQNLLNNIFFCEVH